MLDPGDIEHVESIVTKRFPLRNCGSWNRIKKVLLEPAAQSGEAPVQRLKAEISALAKELSSLSRSDIYNGEHDQIAYRMRQLSSV